MNYIFNFLYRLWTTIFGEPSQAKFIVQYQHIVREHLPSDPKYPVVHGYLGKRKMFAIKDNRGKKYDVDCLIVNNRFVIIDHRDGNKRKYIIREDTDGR